MKILFVIDSLRLGGAERQMVELIKGLDRHRFEVYVVCLNYAEDSYAHIVSKMGIGISYFCRRYSYDISPLFSIYQFIKKNRIDLVHAFNNLGALFGVAGAKLTMKPVVCSAIRDAKDWDYELKILKKILAFFSDIFVANSKAGFTNRFKKIKSHFRVVYNGIDFNRFGPGETDSIKLKEELNVSEFKYVIGMVASLTDRKDHEILINAVPKVLDIFPETCFLLIGDGLKREKLTDMARRMGLEKNVLFCGYRNDTDRILQVLDLSILLTNSDMHLEGISNAIMEAMAASVPVIASKGGGTDEIIKHNINGILVNPKKADEAASAIIRLLGNKKRSERLAQSAIISVKKMFDLQKYANAYQNIYNEVLSKKSC